MPRRRSKSKNGFWDEFLGRMPDRIYSGPVGKPVYSKTAAAARAKAASAQRRRKTPDDLNREFLERHTTRRTALKSASFRGRKIQELQDGSWVVPSIDRESHFDTLQDAKAFVSSWKRNPVTDRAHRYRAQKLAPSGPKVCALCGSKKNVVPDHKDGHPDHTTPSNLQWLCKSCNTAKGFWMRNHGKGRLTHQYNPAEGVPSYQQYAWAVSQHSLGAHDEGGAIIHATPKKLRSEYAKQIADTKRSRGRMADDERWNPNRETLYVVKAGIRPVFIAKTRAEGEARLAHEKRLVQSGHSSLQGLRLVEETRDYPSGSVVSQNPGSAIPVLPPGADDFASIPSQADFPALDEAVAYAEAVRQEHPAVGVLGRIDGATNKPVYAVIFDFSKLRAANPAKFDRCVREVKARGGDVNAYAVCTAAGTRNPAEAWQVYYKVRGRWQESGEYSEKRWAEFYAKKDADGREWKVKRVTRRRNPESASAALYESFHGVPSTTILEIEELEADHGNLALLGRLVDCYVITLTGFLAHFEFDENPPVWCSSSENGKQLYFVGGDQDIDLAAFKMDGEEWRKDRMVIGQFAPPMCGKCGEAFEKRGKIFTCPKCGKKVTYEDHDEKDIVYNLGYHTAKEFDGMEPIDYQHDLGEETGVRPMLEFDPRTKHLYVTGGQYRIEQPLFETSPGIEN
jgi:predicted RNA-binding Zn-ribbon protein involved in translation (DUF1610 family)/5-methylcytosine-specific restriction endonuclease McrA